MGLNVLGAGGCPNVCWHLNSFHLILPEPTESKRITFLKEEISSKDSYYLTK